MAQFEVKDGVGIIPVKALRFTLLCLLTITSLNVSALPKTKEVNGIWYSIDSTDMTCVWFSHSVALLQQHLPSLC